MRLLGEKTSFPTRYAPELLEGIPRSLGRGSLPLNGPMPFVGEDIWNGYELTWRDADSSRPQNGFFRLTVPADSERLVESKSLKLYLGSLTNEPFESAQAVAQRIAADLTEILGTSLHRVDVTETFIDSVPSTVTYQSDLLRSICPVTAQPDFGSVLIRVGNDDTLDPDALDELLINHRDFPGFHEQCCEWLFLEITRRFSPRQLVVGCFYTRRGGIDINPIRRLPETPRDFLRYWRLPRQ
jgi:7-cyano-7-deazaguanine reductase